VCVYAGKTRCQTFRAGNGVRQGSILSPALFNRYIRDLLWNVADSHVGCNIGGLYVNVLAYADDIVLLASTWRALQQLLAIHDQHIDSIDMVCNAKKSVCMIFAPRDRSSIMNVTFPKFTLSGSSLQYVKTFKYLEYMISDTLSDDDDMQREIRNLFTRCNILARHFAKCSVDVKIVLFKMYCICIMLDCGSGISLVHLAN